MEDEVAQMLYKKKYMDILIPSNQQQLRYDYLGMIQYRKVALRWMREDTGVAILDDYFLKGKKKHVELYKEILEHSKNFTLTVHLLWENDHRFRISHRKEVVRRTCQLYKHLGHFAERVKISPFLEHEKKEKFMAITFRQLREVAPDFGYVSSYYGRGEPVRNAINEVHGAAQQWRVPYNPYNFSTDGEPTDASAVKYFMNFHKTAKEFGVWHYKNNGKKSLHDSTHPLKRTNWPRKADIIKHGDWYYENTSEPRFISTLSYPVYNWV